MTLTCFNCSDCNGVIPNLQRQGLYCSDTDQRSTGSTDPLLWTTTLHNQSDTTSRTYLKGTMKYFKVGSQRRYHGYWNAVDIFYYEQSTQEMIIGAGEVITLKMFNIESSSSTSLFAGKTANWQPPLPRQYHCPQHLMQRPNIP